MKGLKKYLMLFSYLIIQATSMAIGIEPVTFGERIDVVDGGYKEYTIINDNSSKARYRIEIYNSKEEDKSNFNIEIYPKVVMLNPYEEKKVKVVISEKNGKDVADGEYGFSLIAEPIEIPTVSDKRAENNRVLSAKLGTVLTIDLIGYVGDLGDIAKDVNFENIKKSSDSVKFTLNNKMNRSIKIIARVYRTNSDYEDFTFIKRVFKNSSKEIELNLQKVKNPQKIEIFNAETNEKIFTKNL